MSAGSHSVREKWTSSWSGGLPKQSLGKATLFLFSSAPWFCSTETKKDQVMEMSGALDGGLGVLCGRRRAGQMKSFFRCHEWQINGVIAEARLAVPETSAFRRALCGENVTCSGG